MPKDSIYHESAIRYNEVLAVAAEGLVKEVKDEEVRRWCRSVGKQHRFHAGRHKRALVRLTDQLEEEVDDDQDEFDSDPEPHPEEKSIEDEQAEYAASRVTQES